MNREELEIFRNQRVASQEGQAVIDHLSNDGTAGHSKGNWYSAGGNGHRFVRHHAGVNLCEINHNLDFADVVANCELMALAQHAPHDCGDPECPGVVNKRKLELYDRFQVAINEFAKAGLLA